MIPTLPLAPRNRLAALILAALSDAGARRELAALAECGERALAGDWLGADELRHAGALRARARRASGAMATLPLESPGPSLATALDAAATLHDAGLHFEVHELLEPYWARAGGAAKETLQGLIQVAVGYTAGRSGSTSSPSRARWPARSTGWPISGSRTCRRSRARARSDKD